MNLNELGLNEEQLASVTKYLQSETDKVRTKYVQENKTLSEELSKYKPKQKSEEELTFESRLKELEDENNRLKHEQTVNSIASKFKESNIPAELAKYINFDEDVDSTVEAISKLFEDVEKEQNNFIPKNHPTNKGITKEDFAKMNYIERAQLYENNPTLFNILSK